MKILIILPRFPYPLEKGDKLRAYHQIKELSVNHDIALFALSHNAVTPEALAEMKSYCKEICIARLSKIRAAFYVIRNFFGVRSLQIGYWDSRKARKLCHSFADRVNPDVVYAQMIRTMKYPLGIDKPRVLDYQDALSMNMERSMVKNRGLRYFVKHYEFKMLRSAEFNAGGLYDGLTVISDIDRNAIPQHQETVIDIVPNGVDFEFFSPQKLTKQYDLVFCGNMQYKPNVDAALFLVNDIMPIVWKTFPNATLLIAGATPTATVRRLASDKVTVSGSVADIRPCYAQSRIFIAPMRIGSGLQNKLLEAMSMGIPCVTTSLANHSLKAEDGKEILVADSPDRLADAVVSLLSDQQLATSLTDNASQFVRRNFSWSSSVRLLENVLQSAIDKHANHEPIELDIE